MVAIGFGQMIEFNHTNSSYFLFLDSCAAPPDGRDGGQMAQVRALDAPQGDGNAKTILFLIYYTL